MRPGIWAVFIAGFSPNPYKVFTIAAGALSMALLPFALASLVGRGARFLVIREEAGAAAEAFSEVWHLSKPLYGSRGWRIAGIQQADRYAAVRVRLAAKLCEVVSARTAPAARRLVQEDRQSMITEIPFKPPVLRSPADSG